MTRTAEMEVVVEEEDEGRGTFVVKVPLPYRRPRLLEYIIKLCNWVPVLREERSEMEESLCPLY